MMPRVGMRDSRMGIHRCGKTRSDGLGQDGYEIGCCARAQAGVTGA